MKTIISILDFIMYYCIILIPLFTAIAAAPTNVFMGLLVGSFIIKKILKKEMKLAVTAINIPLLFFFTINCISLAHSINYYDTIKGGIFRLLLYVFYL